MERDWTILRTKRFLLHMVQLFYDRLNIRQTRRALVEQYCSSAQALMVAGRVAGFPGAVPRVQGLKQVLLLALEGHLATAIRHMQKNVNVYSGFVIRGDGNFEQGSKIAVVAEEG